MLRSITILTVGFLNIVHAGFHILQFVQSMFMFSYSLSGEDNWAHRLIENPYMSIVWGTIGLLTIYIGWKDFKHHKKHKD
jgi:hypothetical protein